VTAQPRPLISIVCAVHNGERFIGEAITSAMAQTGVDLELVVVDDGSTDTTPAILAEKAAGDRRITVVTQENRGVAVARNRAIAEARGEFVAFLDADDVWMPDKLQRQLELFQRDPRLALAFTGYAITDESLRTREVVLSGDLRGWLLLEGNGPGLSSSGMVRRGAVGDDLRFHEELSTSADLEFAWRTSQRGGVATVRAPLVLYRTHGSQMHSNLDAMHRDVCVIYDLVFAGDDPASAAARRRGMANLYTRFAVHDLRAGRPVSAWRYTRRVLALAPSRVILLPTGAAWRRAVRYSLRFLRLPDR
jgi:glycosyltransferase involved in cell wall biosynthesis